MCGLVLMPRFRDVTLRNGCVGARSSTGRSVPGAHFGEGLVLAILAMLARKSALRVAPGGSAPPIPPLRAAALAAPGRDGKAGSPIEQESRFGSRREGRHSRTRVID
jgi:hypothetical protein